jgi:hypothetical protein
VNGVSGPQGPDSASFSFNTLGLSAIPAPAGSVLGPDGLSILTYWSNGTVAAPGYTAGPTGYTVSIINSRTGNTIEVDNVPQAFLTDGPNLANFSWNQIWSIYNSTLTPPPIPADIQASITSDPDQPLGLFLYLFGNLQYSTSIKGSIFAYPRTGPTGPTLIIPALLTISEPIPPPPPPCFVAGTQILTDEGYKAVETLVPGRDLVMTSDGRAVSFKLYSRTVTNANEDSAPYRIFAGAFGHNSPPQDICLSGMHAIQSSDGVWQVPEFMAKKNLMVQQYGLGDTVTYYHIECSNFFSDNLVAQGAVVESFRNRQVGNERVLYKFVAELDGFIRVQEDEVIPVEIEKLSVSVM